MSRDAASCRVLPGERASLGQGVAAHLLPGQEIAAEPRTRMRTGRYVAFASVLVALTAAAPAHGVLDAGVAGAQVALRSTVSTAGRSTGCADRRRTAPCGVPAPRGAARRRRRRPPHPRAHGQARAADFGRRLIRRGMVGWDVSVLQFRLSRRGAPFAGSTGSSARTRSGRSGAFRTAAPRCGRARRPGDPPRPSRQGADAASSKPYGPVAREPAKVERMLGRWARHYGVSPSLVRAVAWMESGFQWNVRSSARAWG